MEETQKATEGTTSQNFIYIFMISVCQIFSIIYINHICSATKEVLAYGDHPIRVINMIFPLEYLTVSFDF